MKKFVSMGLSLMMMLSIAGCADSGTTSETSAVGTAEAETVSGSYSAYVQGDDWGAGTSTLLLTLDKELDAVSGQDFIITETKKATNFEKSDTPVEEVTGERTILSAYLSDENGVETTSPSKNVTIELEISPTEGSPFLYSVETGRNTWSDPYLLTINKSETAALKSGGKVVEKLEINPEMTGKSTSADMFTMDTFTATDGVTYEYASFTPQDPSDTLVVWLHGGGEGAAENSDPQVVLLANEAANLGGKEFQEAVGGAYVLVPQSPTYWMDNDGTGQKNDTSGQINSFYQKSLEELIESYKTEHDLEKVVLVGCSNGGYMTMVLALNNPDAYTAIVPICEGLKDEYISDEQLAGLKSLPMYFVYSEDDTTLDPAVYSAPTIERLRTLGAENLEVSTTEHVVDLSGRFKNDAGEPHQYSGHWSWIYFFNNESVSEDGISSWDWLAEQVK